MADQDETGAPKGKKKAGRGDDRDTFRFQMSDENRTLVAQAAAKTGDVTPQAFAHRAVILEARRVLAEMDPAELRMMENAFAALRSAMRKDTPPPPDESA